MKLYNTQTPYSTIILLGIFLLTLVVAILSFGGKNIEAQTNNASALYGIPNEIRDKVVDTKIVHVRLSDSQASSLRSSTKISRLPRQLKDLANMTNLDSIRVLVKDTQNTSSKIAQWFTFEFNTEEEAEMFLQEVTKLGLVEAVERDWKTTIQIVPTDEFYQPESTQSLWGHEMIQTQALWDVIPNPGEGVVVGVVDTGISNAGDINHPLTHPDLFGGQWINTDEIPNNGIDDDNNGQVDDRFGGVATPFLFPEFQDFNGHGTHVAGTIGARSNDMGLPGIAFDSTLMPVKLSNGGGWSSGITVAGFVYAVDNGAQVINASIGGPSNTLTNDVVEYAFSQDVLVVAAAGNDYGTNACTRSPGGSEYAVTVSSLDKNGNISPFSNVGTKIDIAAPGGGAGDGSSNDILSTRTRQENPGINVPPVTDAFGNEYISINGTSMATPHVTAAAAIIRQQRPDWNVEEVWAGLKWIAQEPVGADFNDGYGHGILDLSKIPDLPQRMPVAQMYEPKNCFSSNETQSIEIRGSAYVAGADVPNSVRIEIAEGYNVTNADFELLATISGEVVNDVLYTWDATQYPLGAYTLRVVSEFDGYSVEDRNQIAFVMYDFKTSLRMQVMKMLGFQSLMPTNPASSESFAYQPKSYFDRFLKVYNNETAEFEDLVDYPTGQFLGAVAYPGTSPSFVGDNVWYDGFYKSTSSEYFLENPAPVFSPSFASAEALSMFDNTRAPQGVEYLMHPSLDIAETREISLTEKYVLCHLGYSINGLGDICEQYPPVPVDDFVTFGPDDDSACVNTGGNDLWRGGTVLNTLNLKIRLFDFLYDNNDPEITGTTFTSDNDCASAFSINPFARITTNLLFGADVTSSKFTRYSAYENFALQLSEEKRVSEEGRAIFWLCENPYNYICNGDFEKGTPLDAIDPTGETEFYSNHLMQKLVADSWSGIGTTDIFIEGAFDSNIGIPSDWWRQNDVQYLSNEIDIYNTRFAGMANDRKYNNATDHREIMRTQLGKDLQVGQTYTVSFEAWSSEAISSAETSDPDLGNHILYIGLTDEGTMYDWTSEIINPDTGMVDPSVFDQIMFVGDLDEYNTYNSWDTIEFEFSPEMANLTNMYIVAEPEVTDWNALENLEKSYLRYTLIDNISIEPQLPYRDLRVEKELLSSATTSVGETVEFLVEVTNDSQDVIENVQVRDYLPDGFVLESVVVPAGYDYQFINQENYVRVQNVNLEPGEVFSMNVAGSMAVCLAEFRNVALAYSEDYLDQTPENNFVDVFAQYFPFNEEIDNYTGFAQGQMGCAGQISGVVFYDINQDGDQDNGEYGLGNYALSLYRETAPGVYEFEQTTQTSNQNLGQYTFNPQLTGTYIVSVETNAQITFPQDSGTVVNGSSQNHVLDVQVNANFSNRSFGIYDGYTISGFVYHDENGDGARQVSEPLLENADIGIYQIINDSYFSAIEWETTNAQGEYAIDILLGNLDPDEPIYVRVLDPGVIGITNITEPYFPQQNTINDIFLEHAYEISSVEDIVGAYPFGVMFTEEPVEETFPFVFGGYMFEDVDGDGVFDAEESGLQDYTVYWYRENGNGFELIQTSMSDAEGRFDFDGIALEGNHYVVLDSQYNFSELTIPDIQAVQVVGSEYYYSFFANDSNDVPANDLLFGIPPLGCECDPFDLNGDCFVNAADLTGLVSQYGVDEAYCQEYGCTGDFNNDFTANHFDALGMLTMYACPISNPEYAIAGFVYQDLNGDGSYNIISDNDDTPILGAPVRLYKDINGQWEFVAETTTTPNNAVQQSGAYMFSLEEPGDYAIVLQEGFATEALVEPLAGNLILENSPYVHFANLTVSQTIDYDNHFGLTESFPISTVEGYVFADTNQNGVRDLGENGLPGYSVVLLNFFAEEYANLTTGDDGFYALDIFEPGMYILTFDTSAIEEEITVPPITNPFLGYDHLYFINTNTVLHTEKNLGIAVEEVVEEECACVGNLSGGACEVNQADLNILLGNFGCQGDACVADLNQSGSTNTADLLIILEWYGCPNMDWINESPELFPTPNIEAAFAEDVSVASEYFTETQILGEFSYNYQVTVTNTSNNILSGITLENIIPDGFEFVVDGGISSDPGVTIAKNGDSALIGSLDPGQTITLYITISQM